MLRYSDILCFCLIFIKFTVIQCLDNGLARTPPMGWLAWERFQCNVRCDINPHNCIREELFMEMADRLVKDGYRDVGYKYINIDDCWMNLARSIDGNLYPDAKRFSKGIKFLADYMHSRGLKLGIYQDFGHHTCMGYPGIIGHMKQDVELFASWEVDMVKLDACNSHPNQMDRGYIEFGILLNQTKRPMVYSCSWPYYQLLIQMEPKYEWIAHHCNMWRTFHDIKDSWHSIENVIDFFGDNQEVLSVYTGPSHWNDPDMLMIGNFNLTPGQSRAQMAVWCILPAPLLMSNDLRDIKPIFRDILLNKKAIAINQDPLGLPGKRIYKKQFIEVWKRPISPIAANDTSHALLFLNRHFTGKSVRFLFEDLALKSKNGYFVTSVFTNKTIGVVHSNSSIDIVVHGMDVVMLNCQLILE